MKRIGTTSAGTVIVEMSPGDYARLAKDDTTTTRVPADGITYAPTLTPAEIAAYAKSRILKLKPKKRDGLVHSIAAMFQFNGGIADGVMDKVIAQLEHMRVLTLSADGKVRYPGA